MTPSMTPPRTPFSTPLSGSAKEARLRLLHILQGPKKGPPAPLVALLVAAALMGTWVVMAYLPYLVIAGAASGLFTGLCAQFLIGRLDKISHSP